MGFGLGKVGDWGKSLLKGTGSFLFGEGGDTKTGTVQKWNRGQEELFGTLQDYLQKGIGPGESYTGQLPGTVPMSNLENLSLSGLEKMFSGEGNLYPQAGGALSSLMRMDPAMLDYIYKTTVSDPMMQQFSEEIMPTIKAAGAPRLWGTDYQKQEEMAARDLERALVQGKGAITENWLNRALQAALGVPELMTGQMNMFESAMRMGAVPRQIEEAGLTAEYQEWLRTQEEQKTKVNQFLAALGLQPLDTYAFAEGAQPGLLQSFTSSSGGSNLIASLLMQLMK